MAQQTESFDKVFAVPTAPSNDVELNNAKHDNKPESDVKQEVLEVNI